MISSLHVDEVAATPESSILLITAPFLAFCAHFVFLSFHREGLIHRHMLPEHLIILLLGLLLSLHTPFGYDESSSGAVSPHPRHHLNSFQSHHSRRANQSTRGGQVGCLAAGGTSCPPSSGMLSPPPSPVMPDQHDNVATTSTTTHKKGERSS
jgi:hypothetical protein